MLGSLHCEGLVQHIDYCWCCTLPSLMSKIPRYLNPSQLGATSLPQPRGSSPTLSFPGESHSHTRRCWLSSGAHYHVKSCDLGNEKITSMSGWNEFPHRLFLCSPQEDFKPKLNIKTILVNPFTPNPSLQTGFCNIYERFALWFLKAVVLCFSVILGSLQ